MEAEMTLSWHAVLPLVDQQMTFLVLRLLKPAWVRGKSPTPSFPHSFLLHVGSLISLNAEVGWMFKVEMRSLAWRGPLSGVYAPWEYVCTELSYRKEWLYGFNFSELALNLVKSLDILLLCPSISIFVELCNHHNDLSLYCFHHPDKLRCPLAAHVAWVLAWHWFLVHSTGC